MSERRPAILCVGALVRGGPMELIEPLGSLLHRHGIAHRFVVVGEGDGLRGLQTACPDAVFAGRLSPRDLATVMASADLLLRPAETSTSGLVELEAQASGLPVLLTSGGTARDHMRPGVTGLVCPSGDVLGFAGRASELLTDASPPPRHGRGRPPLRPVAVVAGIARARLRALSVGEPDRSGRRVARTWGRRPSCRQPDEGRAMTLAAAVGWLVTPSL